MARGRQPGGRAQSPGRRGPPNGKSKKPKEQADSGELKNPSPSTGIWTSMKRVMSSKGDADAVALLEQRGLYYSSQTDRGGHTAEQSVVEDPEILGTSETKIAQEVFRMTRDMFLPRNSKLRLELNMKPRDDPMVRQLLLIHKIDTRSDLRALCDFAQVLKQENLRLGEKLTAAANSADVTLKSVSSKVEIKHRDLFAGHSSEYAGEEVSEGSLAVGTQSPRSAWKSRHPWAPLEVDESFNPFEEDEIAEEQWDVVAREVIAEAAHDVMVEAGDDVHREVLAQRPPPARRHSSISARPDSPQRRTSVSLASLASQQSSSADKLASIKALPAFMQPLETLVSKRTEGMRRRAANEKKLQMLSSGMNERGVGQPLPPSPPPLRPPNSPAGGSAVGAVPTIRSTCANLAKKRGDDWTQLMKAGYGVSSEASRPRFMHQLTAGRTQKTSEGRAKNVLESMLGVGQRYDEGGILVSPRDLSSGMAQELQELQKAIGVRSRNASIHFGSS